jgi:hypothetical protein
VQSITEQQRQTTFRYEELLLVDMQIINHPKWLVFLMFKW